MKTYLKNLTPEEIIKRLKNGEIIKTEENRDDICIKYYDGVICRAYKDGSFTINAGFTNDNICGYYFETEEPFEIKETGFYETRVGAKVYVNSIDENRKKVIGGVIEFADKYFYWNRNGVYCSDREDAKDIIGKWED